MRLFNITFIILLALVVCTSCEKETYLYNDKQELVLFQTANSTIAVSDEQEENIAEIMIVSTVTKEVDREYVISVDVKNVEDEALQGLHFDLLSPVAVIKAGEYTGTFKVKCKPEHLAKTYDMFASFSIASPLSSGEKANFNQNYRLYMTRVCRFDINDMVGSYVITSQLLGEKIKKTIIKGRGDNELIIEAPYYKGMNLTLTVTKDEYGEYIVNMEEQDILAMMNVGTIVAKATGKWNTCARTMSLTYELRSADGTKEYQPLTDDFARN